MINAKALQALQKDPKWKAMEEALKEYLIQNFIENSAKRDTEFDTIWELATKEGGKYHLTNFFHWIEQEALKV